MLHTFRVVPLVVAFSPLVPSLFLEFGQTPSSSASSIFTPTGSWIFCHEKMWQFLHIIWIKTKKPPSPLYTSHHKSMLSAYRYKLKQRHSYFEHYYLTNFHWLLKMKSCQYKKGLRGSLNYKKKRKEESICDVWKFLKIKLSGMPTLWNFFQIRQ